MYNDTIVAISTPIGEAGIGIVRLSGPEARPIVERLFTGRLSHRRLVYGRIRDPETGETVDEVLAAYMAAPHTYTREDVVEINGHGGPLALQRILALVLREGARLARPGEFTLRAFLNGRLDLAQADSVLDVIQAKTEAGLRLAVEGLRGRLSAPLRDIRSELMAVLAHLSARIDFPEDEVGEQDIATPLQRAADHLERLIAGAEAGIVYRHGVRTAIVGRPNVGKSSLLNLLLRENRAIVTPFPGTTRDTVEEVVNVRGIPFLLIDTAGIVESKDPVEALGVERSRQAAARADLVLLVLDSSAPLTAADQEFMDMLQGKTVLVVANKRDLPSQATLDSLPWPQVWTSALTGEGLAGLEERMVATVLEGRVTTSDAMLVTNPRHKEALVRARKHVAQAREALDSGLPDDCVTIDLTTALEALGEITGETVTDDLLETIFSRFCIGK